ncbi:MAG: DNA methylase [Planctomycetia bacterium]|nr:DNA methylase [Planctomycetia bacterium]
MAQSPAHRFGQLIGRLVEQCLHEPLSAIAKQHGLYLDYKHARAARKGKRKAAWRDDKGNIHDLDYVLEAGGTEASLGFPKAFIEIAYRRYTKHSRNKAQEIQGAIIPLAETYGIRRPFLGVVLAGVFTQAAVAQMRSFRFGVLYFPLASIVKAFKAAGIDAYFDESTSDRDVARKVAACAKLSEADWTRMGHRLRALHANDLQLFLGQLEASLSRKIQAIFVLGLHGRDGELASIDEAIDFVNQYDESAAPTAFRRYEINVRYTNGDEVRGTFSTKREAIDFLERLR